MPRSCLFCDNIANSYEHIWPDWLNEVLPNYKPTAYSHTGVDGTRTWTSVDPAGIRSRIVCDDCNRGWMGDLEAATAPLLGPTIMGRRATFDKPQQQIIATWSLKTALCWDQLNPHESVIPKSVAEALRERGVSPRGTHVFTAATDACWPGDTNYHDYPLGDPNSPSTPHNGYVGTIAIRHLALQVIWTAIEQAEFVFQGPLTTAVGRLWPFERSLTWPPGKIMTPSTVGVFAEHWREPRLQTHPFRLL